MSSVAFPGIIVNSIRVKQNHHGVTRSFRDPLLGQDVTPQKIQNVVDELLNSGSNLVGKAQGDYKIEYNLNVRATSRFAATSKARTFVRFNNPFSVGLSHIKSADVHDAGRVTNIYRVVIEVEK